jgi:hypothetical protein
MTPLPEGRPRASNLQSRIDTFRWISHNNGTRPHEAFENGGDMESNNGRPARLPARVACFFAIVLFAIGPSFLAADPPTVPSQTAPSSAGQPLYSGGPIAGSGPYPSAGPPVLPRRTATEFPPGSYVAPVIGTTTVMAPAPSSASPRSSYIPSSSETTAAPTPGATPWVGLPTTNELQSNGTYQPNFRPAGEPGSQAVPAEPGQYPVRMVGIATQQPITVDSAQFCSSNCRPGTEVRFLVEAPGITSVERGGLKLDRFQTKAGRDVRRPDGFFGIFGPDLDSHVFPGKQATFSVHTDEMLLEQLDGLQVTGSIVIVVAEGTDLISSEEIDLTKKGESLTLGGYQLTLEGEVAPGSNPFAGMFGASDPQNAKHLAFQLVGDREALAGFEIIAGGKPLSFRSGGYSGDHAQYEVLKEGDGRGRIQLKVWKNRRFVRVPFAYGAPTAAK